MPNGVPALMDPAATPAAEPLLTSDSPAIQPTSRVPAWGIYLDGALAIEADSIVRVELKESARVTAAPQEKGAFQSYNKVQAPLESRVLMTKGGSEGDRAAFLDAIKTAKDSLNLYDIVMPEKAFQNVSITGYSLQRAARQGVTLLTVEVMFEEIRQASAPVFTQSSTLSQALISPVVSPKAATGADPINAGTKQPVTPTAAQASPVMDALAKTVFGAETVVP